MSKAIKKSDSAGELVESAAGVEVEAGSTNGSVVQGESKSQKWWLLSTGFALAMVILGGVLQGSLSNRWGVSENVKELGERLRSVPLELKAWRSTGDEDLDPLTLQLLECEGYIYRSYVHQATGERVMVAVFFGPKGPIAVHTPEVCYSAKNVIQTSERVARSNDFDGFQNELWRLGFVSQGIDREKLSVAYGWSDGGPWTAAHNPRFWRTDFLYKIQTSTATIGNKQDSTDEFFKEFLPELRKVMRKGS